MSPPAPLIVRRLGLVPYEPTWQAMQEYTATRGDDSPDECWLLQHPPTYTLGQAGKREHLLRDTEIPVVKIDRGGQVTYHGPGQVVGYLMLDLRRRQLKVREMVQRIEQALIDCLAGYGLDARRKDGAPGVYIDGDKIAALGLRVRNGCSYHGLALNVDMDLAPFTWINPCGYSGLKTIQLKDFGVRDDVDAVASRLLEQLLLQFPSQRITD